MNFPTRVANDVTSSPDHSLATLKILPNADWKAEIQLDSDHLPITITINRSVERVGSGNKTYINFLKANWKEFHDYTEAIFLKQSAQLMSYLSGENFLLQLSIKEGNDTYPLVEYLISYQTF